MQRLNFFVVQQSLEWNTVMQIARGAAIMERDMVRTRPGRAQAPHCPSHLIVKAAPNFPLSLFTYSFQGNQGRKTVGKELRPFFYFQPSALFLPLKKTQSR